MNLTARVSTANSLRSELKFADNSFKCIFFQKKIFVFE